MNEYFDPEDCEKCANKGCWCCLECAKQGTYFVQKKEPKKRKTTTVTNVIYNKNCIEGMNQMPDKSVNMVLTDIPYGEVSQNGAERAKYAGQLRKIDKGNADIITFSLDEFLPEISRVSNGCVYIFCSIEQFPIIYEHFRNHPDFMVRQCAWKKTNPSPANGQHMWLSSIENCVFAKRRKTTFKAHCKSSVWEYPVGCSKLHPTEKPLELFEYLITSSSNEGDIVFDPCIGSGTTAVAALNMGRMYVGFEIDEKYFHIAENRITDAILSKGFA